MVGFPVDPPEIQPYNSFEMTRDDIILTPAPVAQWIERGSPKAEVVGSTPAWGTW